MANPLPKPEKSYRILWILSPVIKVEPLRGRRDCSATQWSVVVGEGLLEGFKLVFGRGHDRGRRPLISIGDPGQAYIHPPLQTSHHPIPGHRRVNHLSFDGHKGTSHFTLFVRE